LLKSVGEIAAETEIVLEAAAAVAVVIGSVREVVSASASANVQGPGGEAVTGGEHTTPQTRKP